MGSERFPGKPLALIDGKPMVSWVIESCLRLRPGLVLLCTDHSDIASHGISLGCQTVLTSPEIGSGTARCFAGWEMVKSLYPHIKTLINVQGDEPGLNATLLEKIVLGLGKDCGVHSGYVPLHYPMNSDDYTNPDRVKVVFNDLGRALYFSRSPIPYLVGRGTFYRHVGVYGFRVQDIPSIMEARIGGFMGQENLEQLAWLDAGIPIYVHSTDFHPPGIDREEDIDFFLRWRSSLRE
jgi:3-deoxy-manno-octulosonate cytidylyltransferase (CMP-KDO synthetase)